MSSPFADSRIVKRSETRSLTILNTATESTPALNFKDMQGNVLEFAFFKIAPVSVTGIPAGAVLTLLANDRVIVGPDGNVISMVEPGSVFIWVVSALAGLRDLKLRLDAAATADVIFQITGYERAEN